MVTARTHKSYRMRQQRVIKPLTPELQSLAEEAWHHVEAFAVREQRRFPAACITAEVGCRIVRMVSTFDPRRSSLKTWAMHQARGACHDAKRNAYPSGTRRKNKSPKTYHLSSIEHGDDGQITASILGRCDPAPEFEEREVAEQLLRGLSSIERTSLRDTILQGESLKSIGERFALSESRISQIRSAAIAYLREARTAERERKITA